MADAFPGGVAYLDPDLRFAYCNEVLASHFGRTVEGMVGLCLQNLALDNPDFHDSVARVASGDEPYCRTMLVLPSLGDTEPDERCLVVSCSPDLDAGGHVRGVFLASTDVTGIVLREPDADLSQRIRELELAMERRSEELLGEISTRRELERRLRSGQNEIEAVIEQRTAALRASNAELAQSEERFRSIVELAADAIIIASASGEITLVNGAACAMFGYAEHDFVGRPIEDLLPQDLRTVHVEHRTAFYADPRPRPMGAGLQLKGLRANGAEFEAEASLTPFHTRGGLMVAASVTDVTEKRRLERAMEQTLANLRRSNAELEQFAYVASHDLQEPLRMVSNYTQLLARRYQGQLDADANDFIGFAVEGASRMQQLINDLLDFSRVESRGRELTPVAMESVIERTLLNLSPMLKDADASVEYQRLPDVLGDENQLAELLQNLIANAVKFRGQEAPRIEVSAELNGEFWTFAVRDNGIGIDSAYKERIFVIFQRLHTRAEYPGTGIGLAVCKRIVERHGGRIWVESAPGAGATFYVTLQAVRADAEGQPPYLDGLTG